MSNTLENGFSNVPIVRIGHNIGTPQTLYVHVYCAAMSLLDVILIRTGRPRRLILFWPWVFGAKYRSMFFSDEVIRSSAQ